MSIRMQLVYDTSHTLSYYFGICWTTLYIIIWAKCGITLKNMLLQLHAHANLILISNTKYQIKIF